MAGLESLGDLFEEELKDIYDAESNSRRHCRRW
jgi:hypothetical protein